MHRDKSGPSRTTTHRSCDTAPSRVVIRTISVGFPSASDLGRQENDIRSPRPASADKSRSASRSRRVESRGEGDGPRGGFRERNENRRFLRFLDIRPGGTDAGPSSLVRSPPSATGFANYYERKTTKRKITMQRNTRARTIRYIENFLLEKPHLIRICFRASRDSKCLALPK